MAKIQAPKRIRAEDFAEDERSLIGKLAFIVNSFMDDVYNALNSNLDFNNLNRQLVSLDIRMGSGATPAVLNSPQIRHTLRGRPVGINCIKAQNLNNTLVYPLATPFVNFTFNENIITLLAITGLQADSEYRLTLEIIGENV